MSFQARFGVVRFMRNVLEDGPGNQGLVSSPIDEYNRENLLINFTYGSGDFQCNIGGYVVHDLPTGYNWDHDLYDPPDLITSFSNGFNKKCNFSAVKMLYIKNWSSEYSLNIFKDVGVGNNWTSFLPVHATGYPLDPLGEFYMCRPKGGGAVSSLLRYFRINNSSGATIQLEVAIAGVGTYD